MSSIVVILRPEPGASETAARARALGLTPLVAPLFEVHGLGWKAPDRSCYDAVFLTSANAPRFGGAEMGQLTSLPAYATGEATAAAARAAGFLDVRSGPADGAAMLALAADGGVTNALHLCGRDNVPLRHPAVRVDQRIVYAAEPVDAPLAVPSGAVVLLHSPRAAAAFAAQVTDRSTLQVAAISRAAVEAAGEGWARMGVAPTPRDEALLEVARALCQSDPPDAAGAGA